MTNLEGNVLERWIQAVQIFIEGGMRLNSCIIARCDLQRRAQVKCLYVILPLYLQCCDEPSSGL